MSRSKRPKRPVGSTAGNAARGSESDFVSLFLAEQSRLYRYVVSLLGTEQDADDLLQEVAAVLWAKFADFRPGSSFFAWGCRIAYLEVQEYRRHKVKMPVMLADDVLEQLATILPPEDGPQQHRLAALARCLDKLNTDDRQLVDLCYAPRVKIKDVAAELGRPEASVYMSLGRIRRALLKCISRQVEIDDRGGPA